MFPCSILRKQSGKWRSDRAFLSGQSIPESHGIGSFLGGFVRQALPILISVFKAVGKEALRLGVRVLDDVAGENMDF